MILLGRHVSDEELAAVVDHAADLSPRQAAHLRACGRCSRLMEGHARAASLLRRHDANALLPLPPEGVGRRPSSTVRVMTAVVEGVGLLAAVLVLLLATRNVAFPLAGRNPTGSGTVTTSEAPGTNPPLGTPSPGWTVVAQGSDAGAEWSPDGKWLLTWDSNGATGAELHVSRADGEVARTISSVDAGFLNPRAIGLWLDATSFLYERGGTAYVGMVDTGTDHQVSAGPFPAGAVSNYRGALAFPSDAGLGSASRFETWTSGSGTSQARPGIPVGWSHDGSMLAIWHWLSGTGPGSSGWLEIVSWPSFQTRASIHLSLGLPQALFDASDAHVYVGGYVLDIAANSVTRLPSLGEVGDPAWGADDDLYFPSLVDGSVAVYSSSGRPGRVIPDLGDSVVGALNGSRLVFWFDGQDRPLAALAGPDVTSISIPGKVATGATPQLSADGSRLVVGCYVGPDVEIVVHALP